ncbi:MAG TPA: universal stress protein [Chroococcales cyanobacterium]
MMKVIVALDLTDNAKQIVDSLGQRKWPFGTAFRLLTVIEPSHFAGPLSPQLQKALYELNQRQHQVAYERLMKGKQELEALVPGCSVHLDIRHGDPRIEILESATDWMCDKIILGAHGRGGNRLLPGSTFKAVLRSSPCSVELVRLHEHRNRPESLQSAAALR